MTLEDCIPAFRLRVMARAQELGNIAQACRGFGIPRTLFYHWRKRYMLCRRDGLHPRRQEVRRGHPSRLSPQHEWTTLALALA